VTDVVRLAKKAAYNRAWARANPERHASNRRAWYLKNRDDVLRRQRAARSKNAEVLNRVRREQASDPSVRASRLLATAKRRALLKGIEFTLTLDDVHVPTHCPVLGIKFDLRPNGRGMRDFWPSIDRIDPARGYTPDNVIVVSMRANLINNNATVAQIKAVADFYGKLEAEKKWR